jgi:two-component system, chemotaxis family, CheB/CheR fusion protein
MMARKIGESKKSKVLTTSSLQDAPDSTSFFIVGIGASAGGLAAFEAFFSGMPAGAAPGMAFVLVQHLAPDYKSILAELVQRFTRMQVFEVEDGMKVLVNCVYITPPNHDISLVKGALHLSDPTEPRGQRLPIDNFFRSLAQNQGNLAIGIILSGTGKDGTSGIRAIKEQGGMVMVQSPGCSEFEGMPHSALATGIADHSLPPAKMPAQLIAHASQHFGRISKQTAKLALDNEKALKNIFLLLQAQAGHDFSQYKPGTLHRRIERRMGLHHIHTIAEYATYLQETPGEAGALFHDLLIGVTSFFRDPEAFKALEEQVVPKLFAGKNADAVIRVWVPGCSTGEEAYSIAILLAEHQEKIKQRFKIQIFATDIDLRAIVAARGGLYPATIAKDISEKRLKRFFVPVPDRKSYQIHKDIREMLIFSEHNLIKDPPFSKLDLISCRNLLIYLHNDLQRKIIRLFHYALNRDGFLFQGNSETVSEFAQLFVTLDRTLKLYQRREYECSMQNITPSHDTIHRKMMSAETPRQTDHQSPDGFSLQKMTEMALLQRAPTAVLVNDRGDTLYFHGRTGMYLEPALGTVGVSNIIKMAREGLENALTTTLCKAVVEKEIMYQHGLPVKTNGDFTVVNLAVQPIPTDFPASAETHLYLVTLETAPEHPVAALDESEILENCDEKSKELIVKLRDELIAKEKYIHEIHNKLQISSEELKSSSEEMQSVNEELQSTNEELETSREELLSVNEELNSVNNKLQANIESLSQANNDMNNMLSGTGIGTVFVDHELNIVRYTPKATRLINLIPSDIRRPVGHIVTNLRGYISLEADIQEVLNTLVPKELEVQSTEGEWFCLRIQPYRTNTNIIEGAVITFMDISETIRAREALRKANDLNRLAVVVRDSFDAVTVQDLDGRIIAWNPGAVRMYGWSEEEALTMNVAQRIPKEEYPEELKKIYELSLTKSMTPYRTRRLTRDGMIIEICLTSSALVDENGKMYAIATTERTEELKVDHMRRIIQ